MIHFRKGLWIAALALLMIVPMNVMAGQEGGAPDLLGAEIAACPTDTTISIASSLPDLAFPFFVHMQNQIGAEAESIGNITLTQTDGENDTSKQTGDVEAAIVQGVNAIVISPIEVNAISPVLQTAIDAGIPVVTIDRRVDGVSGILAHVGADNVRGGEIQAETVMAMFPDGARIFHLQGQPGAGPAIDRNLGVHNILDSMADKYPIVFEQTANFRRDQGLSVTEAGLAGLDQPPNVIIAANDDMALGALEAVIAIGMQGEIAIFGFDALPEALASVRDGGLTGTIEQFPGGQSRTAMRIAALNARGCEYPVEEVVLLTPIMVTAENLAQAERISELDPMMGAGMGAVDLLGAEIAACPTDTALTMASSLPDLAFPFFVHMQNQIAAETEAIGNIALIQTDGENDTSKQTGDVEAAIIQGVNAIVISPIEVNAISPALQTAIDAGVPVVTIDRRVDGVSGILAHVGADNVRGGEIQAETVMAMFPDGARIFHLQGQPGAGPAIDRNLGVHNILDTMADRYPIVFEQTANFRRDQGLSVTEAGLAGLDQPPNVIIAANDDMALGALEAVIAAGLQDEIAIFGFDALPEALASVRDGGLTGTIEQFPGGQSRTAVRIATLFARGCEYPSEPVILLTPIMITADNLNASERVGEIE
ncbi:MAG: substrate-binding domain-containing protein [Chloroflexota bacterium]|nr:substrate-binding domain-containing protein [Chloroflexota bacterium]